MPSQCRWLPLVAGCVLLRIAPGAAQSAPKVGGYIQVRETYQSPIGLTATLNRVRSSLEGSLPGSFSYRILVEYEASGTATTAASVSLRDAYIRWRHEADAGSSALQQGVPHVDHRDRDPRSRDRGGFACVRQETHRSAV